MKKQFIFGFFILLHSLIATADIEYQGGLREQFISINQYGFEGDHAAQTKREILDAGFQSIVLHLRLAVQNINSHQVYLPIYKSSRNALDVMISRIHQGNAGIILKPGLYQNPELGSPAAITQMESDDLPSLFTSYDQALQLYLAVASQREISTFVLGMGMGKTLTPEFSTNWMALLKNAKNKLDPSTKISLEISHSDDLTRLENWANVDGRSFKETMNYFDEIRFTLPINQILDPNSLILNKDAMSALIQNRTFRLVKLFNGKKLILSNVILPGCIGFKSDESEVECPNTLVGDINIALSAQSQLANDFLDQFKKINSNNYISGLELIVANTDNEPTLFKADRRFPYFNKTAFQSIKSELVKPTLEEYSTKFKSSKASFLPKTEADPLIQKTACIYFDEKDENDLLGPIHARLLENVIGAFKNWRRERRSITLYEPKDLNSCDAVFYLASNFGVDAPSSFYPELNEFLKKKTVVWFNYKMDRFLKIFSDAKIPSPLAFDVPLIIQADSPPTKQNPDPGFYRYFDYKGETFFKQASFSEATGNYTSSPEINQVRIQNASLVEVKATARHSKTNAITPYVVKQSVQEGSFWYFADLPFSFIHYEDRYLIFCDLIWDILNETPPTSQPMALVRIEDVNPSDDVNSVIWAIDYLKSENVPGSLAVIPYYSNLFHDPFSENEAQAATWFPANKNPGFLGLMNYAKASNMNFIFHGVTHQSGDLISGYHGVSAADYEFWLFPENRPLPEDSSTFLTHKLEQGEKVFQNMGITPIAWEVPHYASSVLDSYIFGKTFEWINHRSIYFKSEVIQDVDLKTEDQFFKCISAECKAQRDQKLTQLKVKTDYRAFGAPVIPFITWKDSYGQALIPETLGMIDFAMYPKDTWRPVGSPEDVIRRAKKLKVIRGAIASFFWHPQLLNPDCVYYQNVPGSYESVGGKKTLTTVIEGLKNLGYQFVSTGDCKIFPRQSCGVIN